jgi:hypothetical protein
MADVDASLDDETDDGGGTERDGNNRKRPDAPAFADLASLAVPAPSFRPVATVAGAQIREAATDPIVTASLGPIPALRPTASPRAAAALAPAASTAFGRIAADYGTALKEPKSSIASLPLEPVDLDTEEEFDGQDELIAWAISPPGSSVGMLAPVPIDRALMDHTAGAAVLSRFAPEPEDVRPSTRDEQPLPAAISRDFDRSRFWSDG